MRSLLTLLALARSHGLVLDSSRPHAVTQRTARHQVDSIVAKQRLARHQAGEPRLFFLFMTDEDLPNEDIWLEFFASAADRQEFKAFVHCEDAELCQKNIRNQHMFSIIPTVESEWCYNLVGPMDALLDAALSQGGVGHSGDKFIFVSGTTVPVKPFASVHQALIIEGGTKSNFCITTQSLWAWYKEQDVAVKHHQWVVLSRAHAATILSKRSDERNLLDQMTPLHWLGTTNVAPIIHWTASALHLPHVPFAQGCLDEYLYFGLLYGFLSKEDYHSGAVHLDMNGGPLATNGSASSDLQGRCDTFATFGQDGTNFTQLTQLLNEDPTTLLSGVGQGMWGPLHPIHFLQLSPTSLLQLRRSTFLFARKVDERTAYVGKTTLAKAFRDLVFSDNRNDAEK